MKNALVLAALGILSLALAAALLWPEAEPEGIDPMQGAGALWLDRLTERVSALELETVRLREARASELAAPAPAREPAEERTERLEELVRRIVREELAARSAALEQRAAAERERESERPARRAELAQGAPAAEDPRLSSPEGLERLTRQAQNPARSEEERLQALRLLRGQRIDGEDARLPVVGALIEVGLHSKDAAIRADVWRQMHGVEDPLLRAPLLYALRNDPDARAREEAAESLDAFLPDGEIEQALRTAAEHDADAGVRRQAARALEADR